MRYCFLLGEICRLLLSACNSYYVFPKEHRGLSAPESRPAAYMPNPELDRELKILEASSLFALVDSVRATRTITLDTMVYYEEGIPAPVPVFQLLTLGLWPIYIPDIYAFGFSEHVHDTDEVHQHTFGLKVAEQLWTINVFRDRPALPIKPGEALREEVPDAQDE